MPRVVKPKPLGKVIHYYDRIGVAIVHLEKAMKVGDMVLFKHGEQEFAQPIDSMQVEHESIEKAKKGQEIGVKVLQPTKEGSLVLPAA